MKAILISLAATALVVGAGNAEAAPSFVNGLALDGAMLDLSGGTSANNGRVGYFSDIYYDPNRREWWGLSDRGPGGGTLSYDTRMQRFTLDVNPVSGAISNFKIAETVVFRSGSSTLNGLAPNPTSQLGLSFDPEGLVINPKTGTFLVSDEYGPSLREFSRSGELIRTFVTPAGLVPRSAGGVANFAGDTGNTAGKRTNRGFEGLAISPDGRFAFAMLQSPMLDEGGSADGRLNRIVKFDTTTGLAVAQYAYEMRRSGQGQGISALVAINDNEFYVLERNNRGVGVGARFDTADKELFRINLSGATDVSGIDLDAPGAVFTRVTKSDKILDLDANTLAALGNKSPEKWEGLAIGPRLSNGSYMLLAGTDNDYSVTQDPNLGNQQFDVYFRFSDADPYADSIQCPLGSKTGCTFTNGGLSAALNDTYQLLPGVLHSYTISATELGAYVAPASVVSPAPLALMAGGFAAAGLMRRRSSKAAAR